MFARVFTLTAAALIVLPMAAFAAFTLDDDGKALTISENGKTVLVYRYMRVDPPEGVPEQLWRMGYIHPLYGLDGDILTQDFPDDHRHHRGIFWAWPNCRVGERPMDIWLGFNARQIFEEWVTRHADSDKAEIAVKSSWQFDDDPQAPIREEVRFTVHPADEFGRAIDFHLKFTNIIQEEVLFLGSPVQQKGYGGFCIRPDKARVPLTFTAAQGHIPEDKLALDTPWADVTSTVSPDGPTSGMAVFQHPANPGYPHPGWILRHYGFLGASWPHNDPFLLKPGESFELRYRLYVHRGNAEEGRVAERFAEYEAANK